MFMLSQAYKIFTTIPKNTDKNTPPTTTFTSSYVFGK